MGRQGGKTSCNKRKSGLRLIGCIFMMDEALYDSIFSLIIISNIINRIMNRERKYTKLKNNKREGLRDELELFHLS